MVLEDVSEHFMGFQKVLKNVSEDSGSCSDVQKFWVIIPMKFQVPGI